MIPAAVAILTGIRQIVLRLRRDDSTIFWIRVGAASGMVAAAVQSVWETGLRMPANAALFALLAAIALHDAGARKTQKGRPDGRPLRESPKAPRLESM